MVIVMNYLELLVRLPILILRLPVFLVLINLLVLYQHILANLIIFPKIKRYCNLIINYLLCRCILFSMGVWKIKSEFSILSSKNKMRMNSGFIIISNYSSPIDYFYLRMMQYNEFQNMIYQYTNTLLNRTCPQIVKFVTSCKQNEDYKYQNLSFMESMQLVFNPQTLVPTYNYHSVSKMQLMSLVRDSFDYKTGPIVIFVSGCPSNLDTFIDPPQQVLNDLYSFYIKYLRSIVMFHFVNQSNYQLSSHTNQNSTIVDNKSTITDSKSAIVDNKSAIVDNEFRIQGLYEVLGRFRNLLNVKVKQMQFSQNKDLGLESNQNIFTDRIFSFYLQNAQKSFKKWKHYQ